MGRQTELLRRSMPAKSNEEKKPSKLTELFRSAVDAVTPDKPDDEVVPVSDPIMSGAAAELLRDDYAPIEALRVAQEDTELGVSEGSALPVPTKLSTSSRAAAKPAARKKTVTKKAPARKSVVAKSTGAKKAPAKKKAAAKKAPAKKKAAAKKAPARKKTAAKKAPAKKKATAKKAPAKRKAPAKKAAARKR